MAATSCLFTSSSSRCFSPYSRRLSSMSFWYNSVTRRIASSLNPVPHSGHPTCSPDFECASSSISSFWRTILPSSPSAFLSRVRVCTFTSSLSRSQRVSSCCCCNFTSLFSLSSVSESWLSSTARPCRLWPNLLICSSRCRLSLSSLTFSPLTSCSICICSTCRPCSLFLFSFSLRSCSASFCSSVYPASISTRWAISCSAALRFSVPRTIFVFAMSMLRSRLSMRWRISTSLFSLAISACSNALISTSSPLTAESALCFTDQLLLDLFQSPREAGP